MAEREEKEGVAEQVAAVLLQERAYHKRCIRDIDGKLLELSAKYGLSIPLI